MLKALVCSLSLSMVAAVSLATTAPARAADDTMMKSDAMMKIDCSKAGSMMSEVVGVFGWASPLVMIASALMLFVCYDSLVMPTALGRVAFSPLVLLMIWNLCGTTAAFGLGAETVTAVPSGIIRTLPQNVLAYALAVWVIRQATRLWSRR